MSCRSCHTCILGWLRVQKPKPSWNGEQQLFLFLRLSYAEHAMRVHLVPVLFFYYCIYKTTESLMPWARVAAFALTVAGICRCSHCKRLLFNKEQLVYIESNWSWDTEEARILGKKPGYYSVAWSVRQRGPPVILSLCTSLRILRLDSVLPFSRQFSSVLSYFRIFYYLNLFIWNI